jgi:hypothetical protein
MASPVETMLKLHKDLPKVRSAPDKTLSSFQPTAHGYRINTER